MEVKKTYFMFWNPLFWSKHGPCPASCSSGISELFMIRWWKKVGPQLHVLGPIEHLAFGWKWTEMVQNRNLMEYPCPASLGWPINTIDSYVYLWFFMYIYLWLFIYYVKLIYMSTLVFLMIYMGQSPGHLPPAMVSHPPGHSGPSHPSIGGRGGTSLTYFIHTLCTLYIHCIYKIHSVRTFYAFFTCLFWIL